MLEDAKAHERRKFPRIALSQGAECKPHQAAAKAPFRTCQLMSLGEGGCFLQTKLTYPKGTTLLVKFTLGEAVVEAVCEVVYAVAFIPNGGQVQFPGMGLQFIEISEDHISKVRGFVTKERFRQGLGMDV